MADVSLVLKLPDMTSKYSSSFSSLKQKCMLFFLSLNIYDSGSLYNLLWIKTHSKS